MTEQEAKAMFILAGFKVKKMYRIFNEYFDISMENAEWHIKNSWWLAITEEGDMIKVGWRKRVISIDWEGTSFRQDCVDKQARMTKDDVTIGTTYIHAWSNSKAVEYLTLLRNKIEEIRFKNQISDLKVPLVTEKAA